MSLEVCSRAPTSNYYGEIKAKFVRFKLKQIYFIIIFFPLKVFFDTANTNKSTFFFDDFGLYLTILGEFAVVTVVTQ